MKFWLNMRNVHNREDSLQKLSSCKLRDTMNCLPGVSSRFNRFSFDVNTPGSVFHPERVDIYGETDTF